MAVNTPRNPEALADCTRGEICAGGRRDDRCGAEITRWDVAAQCRREQDQPRGDIREIPFRPSTGPKVGACLDRAAPLAGRSTATCLKDLETRFARDQPGPGQSSEG